jgi:type IV secretory pathway VirB4 component
MMGVLSPTEDAILNRALILAYQYRGISADPSTHKNPPPRLEDLYKALIGMEEREAMGLAARLEKYVKGSLKGIFDQDSNIELESAMSVFTLRELADEIRPIVMFIILDYIWTKIRKDLKRRLLVVDEAWYLMRYEDSAKVLQGLVKRARKYYLGVTIISQNADDFLNSPYGKAIVTNSALQFLMKQSSAAIDEVAQVFYLSQGERHLLLSANVGEGLFFAGQNHVALRVVSSPDEHALVTSKPQEILARQQAAQAAAGQTVAPTNF